MEFNQRAQHVAALGVHRMRRVRKCGEPAYREYRQSREGPRPRPMEERPALTEANAGRLASASIHRACPHRHYGVVLPVFGRSESHRSTSFASEFGRSTRNVRYAFSA